MIQAAHDQFLLVFCCLSQPSRFAFPLALTHESITVKCFIPFLLLLRETTSRARYWRQRTFRSCITVIKTHSNFFYEMQLQLNKWQLHKQSHDVICTALVWQIEAPNVMEENGKRARTSVYKNIKGLNRSSPTLCLCKFCVDRERTEKVKVES